MIVCFVGDSFVAGVGDAECRGWVGRVGAAARAAGHDLTTYNLGVRRDTSAGILARWEAEVAPRRYPEQPLALVFSFGANDATRESGALRVEPEETLANLSRILARAHSQAPVFFVGPPPVCEREHCRRIAELSVAMAARCENQGVPYLETCEPLERSGHWLVEVRAGDGAHPGAGGYAELAELVANWQAWQELLAGKWWV